MSADRVPIFPLPETVFFPLTALPLHVFEPRYRQMTEDALAGDGRIIIVLLRTGWERDYYGNPPVHSVATLGRIERHVPLPEGRYDILLRGVARVRLAVPPGGECPPGRLYRTRLAEPAPETSPEPGSGEREIHRRLQALWNELVTSSGLQKEALFEESEEPSFEMLVNAIATRVDVPPAGKQALLEEDELLARALRLESYLHASLRFWRTLARFRKLAPEDPRVN